MAEDSEFYDQHFSVIILDEEFKILGESLFPGKWNKQSQFFFTEDGLYLSTSNGKNPELYEVALLLNY